MQILREQRLVAINLAGEGGTFYGTKSRSTADYLVVPAGAQGAVIACHIIKGAARRVLVIPEEALWDRVPIHFEFYYSLPRRQRERSPLWSHDAIAECLYSGEGRAEFASALEDSMRRHDVLRPAWHHTPDRVWDAIAECVTEVGMRFFCKEPSYKTQEVAEHLAYKAHILRRRADQRASLGEIDDNDEELQFVEDGLREVTSWLRKAQRAFWARRRRIWEADMADAWRSRDIVRVHVLARRLAGTLVGPKHRRDRVPLRARPAVE